MHGLFIIWSDINKTGIPIIDEQHRGIVSAINSLYLFMQYKKAEDVFVSTLGAVYHLTKIHFLAEENMLKMIKYSKFEEHKKYHDFFTKNLNRYINEAKDYRDPQDLLKYLKTWWIEHINKEDIEYSPFVIEMDRKHPEIFSGDAITLFAQNWDYTI